jgi:colanic acid/amylovoran biosynthesis protein
MSKILITNAYSGRNKGDGGIIIGMIKGLSNRKGFKEAEISISSADYPSDSSRYSHPVVPSFHSMQRNLASNPYLRMFGFVTIIFPLSLIWAFFYRYWKKDIPLPGNIRQLLRIYAKSDLIIAAGGGYLYTTSKVLGNVVLLVNIYSFYFGVLLGKPVYIYSQSIGPFASRIQSWFVKRALRKVRLIEVREQFSYDLIQSLKVQTPVYLTVDAAFLISSEECSAIPQLPDKKLRLGITARKWFRNRRAQKYYERKMGEFLNWLINDMGVFVFFIPQVTFEEGNDDDRIAARDIYSYIESKHLACLIEEELSPQEMKGLCGEMDLFVGTRMHSNIYALCMNTPTLAIAYQPKTEGIMEQLEQESHVVPIGELSLRLLQEKFRQLLDDQEEIRENLRRRIPRIREEAFVSSALIEQDYLSLL